VSNSYAQFLFYGWGCIFWQAMALQYGKRPVYLISLLTNVIILACAPLCTTTGPYLANRILLGFFGSPVESLAEVSVTDIWFAHQRPKYMALYGWSLSMCGKLAPMISGLINVGMGWKWTLWWCSIFSAIGFVYCFLFLEETNYDRKHAANPTGTETPPYAEPKVQSDLALGEKTTAGEVKPLDSEDRERHTGISLDSRTRNDPTVLSPSCWLRLSASLTRQSYMLGTCLPYFVTQQ
jgi:MFS family permease